MRTRQMLVLGTMGLAGTIVTHGQEHTLRKIQEYDLPGPPGKRFDYLALDTDDGYLISAHLAANQTYVIDLGTGKVLATVTDTPGAEGVEYVSGAKKFYTSNAGDNTIGVVDMKQMKVVKKLKTESKPDGSAYATPFHKLYVSDERGKAEAIVDVASDQIIKTLHFDSETGMPQYDPALDPEHRRAFLSCEGNELMTVFDLDKNQPIAFLPMARGPDVIKFDPGLKRIYVACSNGAISVFQMDDPDHYRKLEDFPVQKKVHSLAIDLRTHRVYAPEQEADGKSVARMAVYEAVTHP
jgi:DNA-binding beta-propeller fold protein YncE